MFYLLLKNDKSKLVITSLGYDQEVFEQYEYGVYGIINLPPVHTIQCYRFFNNFNVFIVVH